LPIANGNARPQTPADSDRKRQQIRNLRQRLLVNSIEKSGMIFQCVYKKQVEFSASHTPAHELTTTVAPFRAWRGLQLIIARGPAKSSIKPCKQLVAANKEARLWRFLSQDAIENHSL